jgi:hypothetical protein
MRKLLIVIMLIALIGPIFNTVTIENLLWCHVCGWVSAIFSQLVLLERDQNDRR